MTKKERLRMELAQSRNETEHYRRMCEYYRKRMGQLRQELEGLKNGK